ncbi:DUF6101 family protein [Pararhizobium haloflavum]|uniref:DUF6101 family protein n=1 Tax=Pararhizobium haloflavum TaxID=2037914 RepID=UPI000C18FF57|nr:DUF6101 family protein [Pararhizobium haloflavum]
MSNTVLKPLSKPVWAGHELRLDPDHLPQQVSYCTRNQSGEIAITLDRRGAVLRRTLPVSGLPLSIALPARAFSGVAARAIDHGDGDVTVTLELHHTDPELCVPLLVSHDLDDIAADWRAWSAAYALPMMMVEADGIARPLGAPSGRVALGPSRPRRRYSFFADRRPRFLVRRKTGSLGIARLVIRGHEIIARQ